jgi:hypothetical protein
MPHKTFAEFDPEDTTAMPCVCWLAGREGLEAHQYPVDENEYEHPDEYLDGVQARYEYENGI